MKHLGFLFVISMALFQLLLSNSAWSAIKETLIEFDRIDGATIHFRSPGETPKPIKTDLHELKYLGTLRGEETHIPPYFLFSAKPCINCAQPIALFVFRSTQSKPLATFVYPGTVLDPKTRAHLFDSRSFFGRCLIREKADLYLSFQRERVDRRRGLQISVFSAEAGPDHLEERLYERGLPRLQDTLKLVKAKQCHEIDGKTRLMLSKPLDLTPRRGQFDDDEDDDEDENDAVENRNDNQGSEVEEKTIESVIKGSTPAVAPTAAPSAVPTTAPSIAPSPSTVPSNFPTPAQKPSPSAKP